MIWIVVLVIVGLFLFAMYKSNKLKEVEAERDLALDAGEKVSSYAVKLSNQVNEKENYIVELEKEFIRVASAPELAEFLNRLPQGRDNGN